MAAEEDKVEKASGGLGPDVDRANSADTEQSDDSDVESTEQEIGPADDEKSQRSRGAEKEGIDLEAQEVTDAPHTLARVQSVASTIRPPPSIVPRSKRRGLLGQLALLPEVDRPYDYANGTKWIITSIVALAAAGAPIGSAIFYPALPEMAADLHTTPTITNLTVALYMLSMSIFPLWWSSFSETFGRRSIYIVSFGLFILFSVLSAVSKSIGMLIAMRILGGGASASVQAVGAGTIADIWETRERGRAMSMFYLGPLMGPLLAPIIGGALGQHFGWRSTMWFLTIYGSVIWIAILFLLPETLRRHQTPESQPRQAGSSSADSAPHLSRMSTRQSVQKSAAVLKNLLVDPLECILYLRFPPVLITVLLAAIAFAALFVVNISTQSAFSAPPYGFSQLIVGLLYFPSSLGYVVASLVGGPWIDHIMAREAKKAGRYDARGKLLYLPEDRMRENAWLAVIMYPFAMIWFGWTIDKGIFWFAVAVAQFIFGLGTMFIFGASTTMLTEFVPKNSRGVALNNFIRNIFSCVGAIVTQPLINAMGIGWLCTMVALFSLLTGVSSIHLLRRHGPTWRKMMDKKLNLGQ